MINEKKILLSLNTDDDPRLIGQDEYVNCENINIGKSEFGRDGRMENMPSTSLIYNSLPAGNNLTIGTAADYSRKRIFYFNWNSTREDGIYCYDFLAQTTYIVLLSSQVQDGLNLLKSFRINREAVIANGLLIFTDNNNDPYCIDIEAGIKLNQPSYVTYVAPYKTPIPYTTITLIRRPPIYPFIVSKQYDSVFVDNYIENNSFQFLVRYQYKNYQYSAPSSFSALIPTNYEYENYNYIRTYLPYAEKIDDYVLVVQLLVRYGNNGNIFIIKKWDKRNSYDKIAIDNHNNTTVPLSFNFYNNEIGEAVQINLFFDSVALKAKTVSLAKNRIFLGNVLKGYTTPSLSSLTISLIDGDIQCHPKSGGNYGVGIVFFDKFKRPCGVTNPQYINIPNRTYLDTSGGINKILYAQLSNGNAINEIPDWAYYYQFVNTKNLSTLFFIQNKATNMDYVLKNQDGTYSYGHSSFSDAYLVGVDISILTGLGIGYSFNEGDLCKLYFQSTAYADLKILAQDGNFILLQSKDLGTLDNTTKCYFEIYTPYKRTATEPFYQNYNVFKINNPTTNLRTYSVLGNFINIDTFNAGQQFVNAPAQIVSNVPSSSAAVILTFNNPTVLTDFTFSTSNKFTYSGASASSFQIRATIAGVYNPLDGLEGFLAIRVNGSEIAAQSIGTGYTVYSIDLKANGVNINPGDYVQIAVRSSVGGSFFSTVYTGNIIISSSIFESMNPNYKEWDIWDTNKGWPLFVDSIGQQKKETSIDFSDTFINGTQVNGLNVFQPRNTKDVGSESGSIQKLQLTNKQQVDGTVMLVITENDHLSAYLSETQLVAAAANDGSPIQSTEVIGTINALKNGFGTINPESVVEYLGTVWGISVLSGVVWQYSNNGVTAISDFKMKRFFDRYSKRYIQQGQSVIEALCGFSYISGAVDVTKREYILTLPQVETNVVISGIPVGFAQPLPSYSSLPPYASSIQNRFDIYDGQGKTIAYKYEENKWRGVYEWLPDCMAELGNKLLGFKNGVSYLFNENTSVYNTIFGVQYPQRICFVVNSNPSAIKDIRVVGIEGNTIPNFSVFYSEYPNIQISDLANTDTDIQGNLLWQNKEGVQYASVLRDRLSPNVSGTADEKLRTGDLILSAYTFVMLEWREYSNKLIINFVNISYEVSRGHNLILPETKK